MALGIDIAIVIILAVVVWRSAVHGFMRTAIEIVGYVLAAVISISFANVAADKVYDSMVRPAVIKSVEECIADAGTSTDKQVDEIWENMPSFVTKTADLFVSKEEMKTQIRRSYNKNIDTVSTVVADLVKPVTINLVRLLVSAISFLILMALVKLLAYNINKFFNLPILNGVNATLGGVIGFVKGAVVICILTFIIKIVVDSMGSFWIFKRELIDTTYIFRYVYNLPILN